MISVELERNAIKERLLSGAYNFDEMAMLVFQYQYTHNELYHAFCRNLHRTPDTVTKLEEIPFLPVGFFKSHEVKTGNFDPQLLFKSSGTTETGRSQHYVRDANWYERISTSIFEREYGPLNDYIILALLPSYLEQGDSSLVYMVKTFVGQTESSLSGFYRYDYELLRKDLEKCLTDSGNILLWGVTYALLDLAEGFEWEALSGEAAREGRLILLETGGMKGRRAELLRSEVHDVLTESFNVDAVHSEYGMTEMLSQCYSRGKGVFEMNQTVRILAYDVQDPLSAVGDGSTGRCHVVDLANLDSCSFIATDDLCRTRDFKFEILGRMDHSDMRGCNLLYHES